MSEQKPIVIAAASPSVIKGLGEHLPRAIFRPFAIQDAEKALAQLTAHPLPVLLFHRVLLNGDGLELCRTLSQNASTASIIRLLLHETGDVVPRREASDGTLIYHDLLHFPTTQPRLIDTIFRWLDAPDESTPDPRTLTGAPGREPTSLSNEERDAKAAVFNRSFRSARLHTSLKHRMLKSRLTRPQVHGQVTRVDRPGGQSLNAPSGARFSSAQAAHQEAFMHTVERRYAELPQQSYWEILSVEPGAEQQVLDDAFLEQATLFDPERHRDVRDPDTRRRLSELHKLICEAYDVLSDHAHAALYETQRATGALRLRPTDVPR